MSSLTLLPPLINNLFYFQLFFSLCLYVDVEMLRSFSQSLSVSLCRHAAQEYIRRQLEEEQRQLEILQQQLLQEQALLLVTAALPLATTASPSVLCGLLSPLHAPKLFLCRGIDWKRIHNLDSFSPFAWRRFKKKKHEATGSKSPCWILFTSLIACMVSLSWLDLKWLPRGCEKYCFGSSVIRAHKATENRTLLWFTLCFLSVSQSRQGQRYYNMSWVVCLLFFSFNLNQFRN